MTHSSCQITLEWFRAYNCNTFCRKEWFFTVPVCQNCLKTKYIVQAFIGRKGEPGSFKSDSRCNVTINVARFTRYFCAIRDMCCLFHDILSHMQQNTFIDCQVFFWRTFGKLQKTISHCAFCWRKIKCFFNNC